VASRCYLERDVAEYAAQGGNPDFFLNFFFIYTARFPFQVDVSSTRDDRFVTAILRNHATSSCTHVNTSVLVNVKL